jgi:prepilin signal peptidase PulO-like enzyme (type II secretory pathway)
MILAIIILAWFGLAFGSFVNALVWRIHEQSRGKKKNSKVNL